MIKINKLSRYTSIILLFSAFCWSLLSTTETQAASLSGLYNTGVDDFGFALSMGTDDPHYSMTGPASPAKVTTYDTWVVPPAGSAWIGPDSYLAGDYTYSLTFDLSGFYPESVSISGSWSTDNTGMIYLNGVYTGFSNTSKNSWASLYSFTLNDGFITGSNTLEFHVTNLPEPTANPTGLLVANLNGQGSPVPIPGAFWLLGTGLVGLAILKKKIIKT